MLLPIKGFNITRYYMFVCELHIMHRDIQPLLVFLKEENNFPIIFIENSKAHNPKLFKSFPVHLLSFCRRNQRDWDAADDVPKHRRHSRLYWQWLLRDWHDYRHRHSTASYHRGCRRHWYNSLQSSAVLCYGGHGTALWVGDRSLTSASFMKVRDHWNMKM